MSQRQAPKVLEREQEEQLGEVSYPGSTQRIRFKRNRGRKNVPSLEKALGLTLENDTAVVSDLQVLIDAGKKFGTIYADPPWPCQNQALP